MNVEKANEIFKSLGVIDVSYNGNKIWIESIDEQNSEASVRDLITDKKFVVNVSELKSDD